MPASARRKILAISVNNLNDVFHPHRPLFRWLRQRKPVAKIGYSIFVYDLTHDTEGLAELQKAYAKLKLPRGPWNGERSDEAILTTATQNAPPRPA